MAFRRPNQASILPPPERCELATDSLAHNLLAIAMRVTWCDGLEQSQLLCQVFPVEEHDLFASRGQRVAIHSRTGAVALSVLLTRLAGT